MNEIKEYEAIPAYAKIQGPNFIKFVTKLTVYLGREVSLTDFNPDEEVIFISNSNKISRKHLKIFWDEFKSEWFVQNLSKNYTFVNKTVLKSTDDPRSISPISSIQIDDCKFYFFQSREMEMEVEESNN
jgi:hypothetical protein